MKQCPLILLLTLALFSKETEGAFTVSGRDILRDGEVFSIRGVCYQPTPIGINVASGPPYGDFYTSEYLETTSRDMANLRRMGANVMRFYGWTIGADHSAFLDLAYNEGKLPLYVLINRWINPETDWSNPAAVEALKTDWGAIADELKDHPAVLGFLIGNEVNWQSGNGYNPAFWAAINEIAGTVKAVAPGKLVSTAITDNLGQVGFWDATMSNLDFWAIQVYRGSSFYSFFDDYGARSEKPLLITEFGHDAYNNSTGAEFSGDAAYPADVMEGLWNELQAAAGICSGGCVFEYQDEWWKAEGSPFVQDAGGWSSGAWVDGAANEEWWGIFRTIDNGREIDIVEPRAMFYRLASMWNLPHQPRVRPSIEQGQARFSFTYPFDLRDQVLEVEVSVNAGDWIAAADNREGIFLQSSNQGLVVQSEVIDNRVEVVLLFHTLELNPVFLRIRNTGR